MGISFQHPCPAPIGSHHQCEWCWPHPVVEWTPMVQANPNPHAKVTVSTREAHRDGSWDGPIRMKHRTHGQWLWEAIASLSPQINCHCQEIPAELLFTGIFQTWRNRPQVRTGRGNQRRGAGALTKPYWKSALTLNFSATRTNKFSLWFLLRATQSFLTSASGM